MRDREQIRIVVQELVNTIHDSISWEVEAIDRTQRLGLQGEKRRNRYDMATNIDLLNHIKCMYFDLFGTSIKPDPRTVVLSDTETFSSYFSVYLKKQTTVYDSLHDLANRLVALNMQPLASKIYKKLECITENIICTNRIIFEGEKTNWSPDFIFLHQTTDENIHDKYEEKEKERGYVY